MSAAAPERIELAPGYAIARVLNGGWQLARDHGAGAGGREARLEALTALAEHGFTTFDCADIYTGVEELLGELLRRWRAAGRERELQIHTKYVPDRSTLPTLGRAEVAAAIDRSLVRLGVERLDLVQLHWWEYGVPGYVETAGWLDELRRAGKIRHLGLTNFDRPRLRRILDAGIEIVSHQVQYSLLDRRPEHGMAALCGRHGVRLLAYGALAGGFLSGRWLGVERPRIGSEPNRSLTKYRLIVEEFGGWEAHQRLLDTLAGIASKHQVTVATVAARWVLDRSPVAAIILGAASAGHLEENLRLGALRLDREDAGRLDALLAAHPGPPGDVYDLERRPGSRHRRILRTELHADPPA